MSIARLGGLYISQGLDSLKLASAKAKLSLSSEGRDVSVEKGTDHISQEQARDKTEALSSKIMDLQKRQADRKGDIRAEKKELEEKMGNAIDRIALFFSPKKSATASHEDSQAIEPEPESESESGEEETKEETNTKEVTLSEEQPTTHPGSYVNMKFENEFKGYLSKINNANSTKELSEIKKEIENKKAAILALEGNSIGNIKEPTDKIRLDRYNDLLGEIRAKMSDINWDASPITPDMPTSSTEETTEGSSRSAESDVVVRYVGSDGEQDMATSSTEESKSTVEAALPRDPQEVIARTKHAIAFLKQRVLTNRRDLFSLPSTETDKIEALKNQIISDKEQLTKLEDHLEKAIAIEKAATDKV